MLAFTLVLLGSACAGQDLQFNRDVRPILSENCFHCHGPDEQAREADLRLDVEEAAKEWAIVAGSPEESELIRRVKSSDESDAMPPADSGRSLSPAQVRLLEEWVKQGAAYQSHWSFIAPTKPSLPALNPPGDANGRGTEWCRNEIDHFVLARLQASGTGPSPEANKETLIRRVTFDLTGLPPTLEEIDGFLTDDSPQAYDRLVDRLLASEAYGERMTSDWLDVARYSDTYGYQVDRDRFVWPWRDWVIRAFNANMPYDQFVTQQLAGDLLEGAGREEILATTFNRLHPQKVEGGSVPEEFRIEYIADRTQTFATAFLGLTMECCRCHDHKYDPITQHEYYQLSGFFDQIDEAGLYSYFTPAIPTPTLLLPTDEQAAKIDRLRREVAAAEAELGQVLESREKAFVDWLCGDRAVPVQGDGAKSQTDGRESGKRADAGSKSHGMLLHMGFESDVSKPNQQVPGKVGHAVKLSGDDAVDTKVGNFSRSQPFSVAFWMKTPNEKQRAVVFHRSRAWTDAASRGYELLIDEGRLRWSLIHFWPGNAISIRTADSIPIDEWVHVVVTSDGSSRADGLRVFLNGAQASTETVRDNLTKQITGGGGDNIAIGQRFRDRGFTKGLVDEFQVFDRCLSSIEAAQLHDGESLDRALQLDVDDLTERQRTQLRTFFFAAVDSETATHRDTLRKARQELHALVDSVDEIMVMRETPIPRPTFFLKRGAYDARGDQVAPQTPSIFGGLSDDAPRTRLGLAEWLTNPRHPLTARVAVNRLWQMCFGRGLVTTPEDFGSQGQPPTHPLLLDWLAVEFVEQGWDVKRLLKTIVTSSTYRQSSQVTTKFDPENRLLGRGPSNRLPAEMLRDNALAVSGLLVSKIGGPPVKPYEVEESFKPVKRDQGENLYRRSLYTYWKRTGPAPEMMTLDASTREVCRVRRERTSSPLQALVLLNGPQYVEASRALAERMIRLHGESVDRQLVTLFRLLTSRRPTSQEQIVLSTLYNQQLEDFTRQPELAAGYLTVGETPRDESLDAPRVAALAMVAGMLLNFDECVTKR